MTADIVNSNEGKRKTTQRKWMLTETPRPTHARATPKSLSVISWSSFEFAIAPVMSPTTPLVFMTESTCQKHVT